VHTAEFYKILRANPLKNLKKNPKLTEIFEYAVKTTFVSQNFKNQCFSKLSSTILLEKNTKNSIEELFTTYLKMA
jgi:hypothetical protein